MSDSVTGGCLVHYNNQHIQVRKDFFDLCAYDKSQFNQTLTKNGKKANDEPNQECMAKILRLLETLTDHEKTEWHLKAERLKAKGLKISAEPKEYRIELAYSTIARLLFGTYGESTIRKSIAVLLERNYIKRYQATKNSVPCYVLNIKVLQAALNKQAQEAMLDPSEENEVSNLTPGDNVQVSNLTANPSNLTPEIPSEENEVSNLTPNNIDKKETKKTKERKNATSRQRANATTQQEASHSLVPDSQSHEDEKPEETKAVLTEDEQRIVDFATKDIFKAMRPEVTEKLKGECAILAPHIKTQKQFDSLVALVKTKFDGVIYLKNLVNALNDWLQIQPSATPAKSTASKGPSQLEILRAARAKAEQSRLREEAQKGVC